MPWESSWRAGCPDEYTGLMQLYREGEGGLVCSQGSEGRQPLMCISIPSSYAGHTSPRIGSSHTASSPGPFPATGFRPQGFSTIISGWEPGTQGKQPLLGTFTSSLGDPPFSLVKRVIPCDPDKAYVVRELIMGKSYRTVTSSLWS